LTQPLFELFAAHEQACCLIKLLVWHLVWQARKNFIHLGHDGRSFRWVTLFQPRGDPSQTSAEVLGGRARHRYPAALAYS
jgi:hypothetical protein